MKRTLALALCLAMASSVLAQTTDNAAKPKARRRSGSRPVSTDIKELKDAVAAQQEQIKQLQEQLQSRDQAINQLQQQVGQAESAADRAARTAATAGQEAAAKSAEQVSSLQHDVTDIRAVNANTLETVQDTQKRVGALESPLAIRYKGITITPGGFLAAETVYRSRGTASDINTPFNAIPASGASQARLSEFYASGRQSRVSMLAEGKLDRAKLTGYVEADFLSAGVTSNNNQSNSYTLRQRQVWGQAALTNGWTFTGGQMWSLVAETRKGLDNRAEALPMTIDPQYTVGFSWARQYGFRVSKNFHNKAYLGFSVENSQETLTAHGQSANFLVGSAGTLGGLYNSLANYSFNRSPDFIAKAAFEPGFGHYEVYGILSQFRDRVFPNAGTNSVLGAHNVSTATGGVGANARWLLAQKHVEVGIHYLGGQGVGRYGTAGLADVTVRPDGSLAPMNSQQGLGSLEFHSAKWDWYGYGGVEYVKRNYVLNSKGAAVGYGSPLFNNTGCTIEIVPGAGGFSPGALSNCNFDTRALYEGSFGFWYKPYNGPRGRLQMGAQYSYLTKEAWTGYGTSFSKSGANPNAIENMVFTSFRYYLP